MRNKPYPDKKTNPLLWWWRWNLTLTLGPGNLSITGNRSITGSPAITGIPAII